jgi:hypothetical protein
VYKVIERRTLAAALILNLEDAFARERARPNAHPRPIEPLRFWLVKRDAGGAVTIFDPPLELKVIRNQSGYHLFFGREVVQAAASRSEQTGRPCTRQISLPAGSYTLRITSPFYQSRTQMFALPMGNPNMPDGLGSYSVDLQPGYSYPFPDPIPQGQVTQGACSGPDAPSRNGPTLLRGVLLDISGQGVSGATIRTSGRSNVYETDESGQWVLWFRGNQASGPVTVLIEAPGKPTVEVGGVCVLKGYETTLRQTALRGWVRRGGIGVPNAVITVTGSLGQALTAKDGSWTYVFPYSQAQGSVEVKAALQGEPEQKKQARVAPRATTIVDPFLFA